MSSMMNWLLSLSSAFFYIHGSIKFVSECLFFSFEAGSPTPCWSLALLLQFPLVIAQFCHLSYYVILSDHNLGTFILLNVIVSSWWCSWWSRWWSRGWSNFVEQNKGGLFWEDPSSFVADTIYTYFGWFYNAYQHGFPAKEQNTSHTYE